MARAWRKNRGPLSRKRHSPAQSGKAVPPPPELSRQIAPEPVVELRGLLAEFRALLEHERVPARGYLNLSQTSAYLSTAPGTVREWIRTKRLSFYKPGRELLFKRHELDQWMDRHRKVAGLL